MLKVQQYKEINSAELEGVFDKMIHLVSVVLELDPFDVQDWKTPKLIEAYKQAEKGVRVSERYQERILIGGMELEFLPFTQLTLGQFINLEEYVCEDFTKNISKIAATIYLSQTPNRMYDSVVEDYSKVNVDYRSELFDQIPINHIYGACKKYLDFRQTFFASYELFSDPYEGVDIDDLDEEEKAIYDQEIKEREKQGDNQWLVIMNILSHMDITKFPELLKLNLFLAFNQLSYIKSNK